MIVLGLNFNQRETLRPLAIFIITFYFNLCVANSSPACKELFRDNSLSLSLINYSAGMVKDIYFHLPFPQLEFHSARPIRTSEVQIELDKFVEYEMKTRELAKAIPRKEGLVLERAAEYYSHRIAAFSKRYSSFNRTSLTLSQLVKLSNVIKGRSFEALVSIILLRNGQSSLVGNTPLFKIIMENFKDVDIRDQLHQEIDLYTVKDGIVYLYEMKSIKPQNNKYINSQVRSISEQISSRNQALEALGIRDRFKIVYIQHFDLGKSVAKRIQEAGADEVISIRREYLDDLNSY